MKLLAALTLTAVLAIPSCAVAQGASGAGGGGGSAGSGSSGASSGAASGPLRVRCRELEQ
jgi:hypothetical protein